VDDNVDNLALCVGPLGMKDACALQLCCCTGVGSVCTQSCAHHQGCGWCDRRARSFLKKIRIVALDSALGPLPDASCEFFDVIEHLAPFRHLGQDFSLRVHDRGVVTAECLADLG
jgi:hypothetical protein